MSGAMSWPFLRLYILVLLYFSANAILNVIIPLQGESLGASGTTIGLIMGAYMFTTMFFRPWAGRIIQKHGPIKILRLILIINGFALILYTFTGLGGYLLARILQGYPRLSSQWLCRLALLMLFRRKIGLRVFPIIRYSVTYRGSWGLCSHWGYGRREAWIILQWF